MLFRSALLEHLKALTRGPWLCIGDFNEIVAQSEKWGAMLRCPRQIEKFQAAVEVRHLTDIGYKGSRFTWNNSREDEHFIKERLDRALVNRRWCSMFNEQEVQVLAARLSDHKPLLVLFGNSSEGNPRRRKGFKFEASWTMEQYFHEVITEI